MSSRILLGVGLTLITVGVAALSIPGALIIGGVLVSAVALFIDGN